MPKIAGKNIPYEDKPKFKGQNPAAREASKMGQELEYIPLNSIESEFPIENAMERSENYQLGGEVQPPTSPSMGRRSRPMSTINTSRYKKGGKV